jgi:ketosteroid isomerase-like protein
MGEALEIVRRRHDAFQREDWDAFFALYHPDVEIDLSRSGIPGAGVHHGHDGIREGWIAWRGAWDDYEYEVEELTELGHRVLSLTRIQARSKGHGVDIRAARGRRRLT